MRPGMGAAQIAGASGYLVEVGAMGRAVAFELEDQDGSVVRMTPSEGRPRYSKMMCASSKPRS